MELGIVRLFSDPTGFLLSLLYRLPAVIIALSFHEWAHAFAAYRLGDPTAKMMGRMTLDPVRHIDPIGFLSMILIGFGWAKPVPVNVRNLKKPFRDDILVSIAGVSVNFILANVGALVFCLLLALGVSSEIALGFIDQFVFINIGLMVFNLLPIPPLDGYHVFKGLLMGRVNPSFFWNYERYGSYILLILVLTGTISSIIGAGVSGIYSGIFRIFAGLFGII